MAPTPPRLFALTTRGKRLVHETAFQPGDWLVFGAETRGLAPALRESFPAAQRLRLPMRRRPAQPQPVECGRGDGVRGLAAERVCLKRGGKSDAAGRPRSRG